MTSVRTLVAGIGNIFLGDDGFGCEVARRLMLRPHAGNVWVRDFGIRGLDLAFALSEGYERAILVDAMPRGGPAGSIYLVEPDLQDSSDPVSPAAHGMAPVQVLRLAERLGGSPRSIRIVGCEPSCIPSGDDVEVGLSPAVAGAVDEAVELVEELLAATDA